MTLILFGTNHVILCARIAFLAVRHDTSKLKNFNFEALWHFRAMVTEKKMATKSVNKELMIEALRKLPCLYDRAKDELVRENVWKRLCSKVFTKEDQNETELAEGNSLLVSFVDLFWCL